MEIRIERVLVSTFLIRALATTEHAEVFLSLSSRRGVYIAQLKNVHILDPVFLILHQRAAPDGIKSARKTCILCAGVLQRIM